MIFVPYAMRKFGYEFRCLKSNWCGPMTTPWTWHARAWWGCRTIAKSNRTGRGEMLCHPLVYKLVDARPESTVTCYCGEMNGQYVPSRDANKVWFEQVPPADPVMGRLTETDTAALVARVRAEQANLLRRPAAAMGRELTDDEAATATRVQMEAETIRAAGGGRWIGPDETGGRRFKMPGQWADPRNDGLPIPSPIERAGMAMGTRLEIRSEQGNVFVRITCTRCGEQMSEKQFYAEHFTGTPATLQCVRDDGQLLIEYERIVDLVRTNKMSPIVGRTSLLDLASSSRWTPIIGGDNAILNGRGLAADSDIAGDVTRTVARGGKSFDPDGDIFPSSRVNMDGEWEEQQACGCTIFRRVGGESVRVTNNCSTHGGMLLSAPPALTGRARIALDEEV